MSTPKVLDGSNFTDPLTEVLNIGVGRAASTLSEILDTAVQFEIPQVQFMTRNEAAHQIGTEVNSSIRGTKLLIKGALSGEALLLFSANHSQKMVTVALARYHQQLSEQASNQDALCEIGNIVLNACLSSIADLFESNISYSVPLPLEGTIQQIFIHPDSAKQANVVLFLNTAFRIEHHSIQGYIALTMDASAFSLFKQQLEQYLALN